MSRKALRLSTEGLVLHDDLLGLHLFLCAVILLRLSHVALGVLHKHRLGLLIAEAIGLAVDHSVDRAIRLDDLAKSEALRTHVVELAGRGHSRRSQTKHKCACKCRHDAISSHRFLRG